MSALHEYDPNEDPQLTSLSAMRRQMVLEIDEYTNVRIKRYTEGGRYTDFKRTEFFEASLTLCTYMLSGGTCDNVFLCNLMKIIVRRRLFVN